MSDSEMPGIMPAEKPPVVEAFALEQRVQSLENELGKTTKWTTAMFGWFRKPGDLEKSLDQKLNRSDLADVNRQIRNLESGQLDLERRMEDKLAKANARIEELSRNLEALIAKLNRSRLKELLDSDDATTSRVRAGDGASKETVRRDYSKLIEKINEALVKKLNRQWHSGADSAALCARAIVELIEGLEPPIRNSALLDDFRNDLAVPGSSDRLLDDGQSAHFAELFGRILGHMATLEYRLRPMATDFPKITSTLGGEHHEVIHDGTIASAYGIAGG